jgi:hypothetical protein
MLEFIRLAMSKMPTCIDELTMLPRKVRLMS